MTDTERDFEEYKNHVSTVIESVVKTVVNGKIDRLSQELKAYIVSDNEWKKKAQPIIDLGVDMRGFGRGVALFLGTVATIIAVGTGFFELIKLIFKK